jgi:penicillin amidase
LPTGQSGNPFSAHYSDQAALYNAGKFRRMLLNKDELLELQQNCFLFLVKLIVYKELKNINQ